MATESIFSATSYKQIMKRLLRGGQNRGALSRAAEAMGCQRSYLSRVMNSKMQLTMDQVFMLSHHLKFTPEEREYFQVLVEHERAVIPAYRNYLQNKISELRKRHESISEIVKKPEVQIQTEAFYFSSWWWSAIHFLTSTPHFKTPQKLSEKLGLPAPLVQQCLEQLREWGFVKVQNGIWDYVGGEFHLSKQNPLVAVHHQNWRSRAVIDSQLPGNDNIHYTNVQTASLEDIERLKNLALEFIRECNHLLGPSKAEDGVVITLDVFKL